MACVYFQISLRSPCPWVWERRQRQPRHPTPDIPPGPCTLDHTQRTVTSLTVWRTHCSHLCSLQTARTTHCSLLYRNCHRTHHSHSHKLHQMGLLFHHQEAPHFHQQKVLLQYQWVLSLHKYFRNRTVMRVTVSSIHIIWPLFFT